MYSCLLFFLVFGLVTALIGIWIGRLLLKPKLQDLSIDIETKIDNYNALKAQYGATIKNYNAVQNNFAGLSQHHKELKEEYNKLKSKLEARPDRIVPIEKKLPIPQKNHINEPADAGSTGPKDDLKRIEGIGPKIEKVLNKVGIYTWEELSKTNTEKLSQILQSAGTRYKMHKPDSWPEQARLAAEGDWEKLKLMQNKNNGKNSG